MTTIKRLIDSTGGGTGIEYGLIAGLIALAIIGSLGLLGDNVDGMYVAWTDKVREALGGE